MRYQLMEDIHNKRYHRLSRRQVRMIQGIARPQLQEDVYLGMTGQPQLYFPRRIRYRQ